MQAVTASDIARLLRRMRDDGLSGWTASAVFRIVKGVFGLAQRRGIVTSNPCDGLTSAERPKQKNKQKIERLDSATTSKLIAAASTERWKAGLGLAGLGGLRLGEVRGLQWGDIDLAGNTISVRRSLLPDGTAKATKTEAGERTVALFPELRRLLVAWKVKSPFTDREDYVLCTAVARPGPAAKRTARAGEGEGRGRARLPRRQALLAQPAPLGGLDLAHRVRDSGHDRERDDGSREPVLHARLLRARSRATSRRWWRTCSHAPQQQEGVSEMLAQPRGAGNGPVAFWTGRLSASIAYFLAGQVDKSRPARRVSGVPAITRLLARTPGDPARRLSLDEGGDSWTSRAMHMRAVVADPIRGARRLVSPEAIAVARVCAAVVNRVGGCARRLDSGCGVELSRAR